RVRWTPLIIASSRDSLGKGHPDAAPDLLELGRLEDAIGIAQPPEGLRIAEMGGRQAIESVALLDGDLPDGREPIRRGDEAPAEVRHLATVGSGDGRGGHRGVATRGWKAR